MIVLGFLIHGRSVAQKEFFLRRITTLSMHLYGIIAVLAKLQAAQKSGRMSRSDLDVLAYFLEEARQVGKLSRRVWPARLERLHRKIISDIISD